MEEASSVPLPFFAFTPPFKRIAVTSVIRARLPWKIRIPRLISGPTYAEFSASRIFRLICSPAYIELLAWKLRGILVACPKGKLGSGRLILV
jgi:hypothetical protein